MLHWADSAEAMSIWRHIRECFFFSSRRRHTRCSRDWSSDVCSSDLIERQLRDTMRERGLTHIQILPEDRPSANPTTEQVIRVFNSRARHLLLSKNGNLVQAFSEPLSPIQEQVLSLLSISPSVYA